MCTGFFFLPRYNTKKLVYSFNYVFISKLHTLNPQPNPPSHYYGRRKYPSTIWTIWARTHWQFFLLLLVGYLLHYFCIPNSNIMFILLSIFAMMIMFALGSSIRTLHLWFECFCVPSPYMNVIILRCLELLGFIGYVTVISWCPSFFGSVHMKLWPAWFIIITCTFI